MADLKKSELTHIVRIRSGSDALGSDCFDIYECLRLPHLRVVHKTGVAVGWEIDEYSSFEFSPENEKILNDILKAADERTQYDLIGKIERDSISVDEQH